MKQSTVMNEFKAARNGGCQTVQDIFDKMKENGVDMTDVVQTFNQHPQLVSILIDDYLVNGTEKVMSFHNFQQHKLLFDEMKATFGFNIEYAMCN